MGWTPKTITDYIDDPTTTKRELVTILDLHDKCKLGTRQLLPGLYNNYQIVNRIMNQIGSFNKQYKEVKALSFREWSNDPGLEPIVTEDSYADSEQHQP